MGQRLICPWRHLPSSKGCIRLRDDREKVNRGAEPHSCLMKSGVGRGVAVAAGSLCLPSAGEAPRTQQRVPGSGQGGRETGRAARRPQALAGRIRPSLES